MRRVVNGYCPCCGLSVVSRADPGDVRGWHQRLRRRWERRCADLGCKFPFDRLIFRGWAFPFGRSVVAGFVGARAHLPISGPRGVLP